MKENISNRKGSFDLLRIILILMVCTLHACGRLDALFTEGTSPDAARYAGMAAESLSIVAVNSWVIMSGYLLADKEFKLSRFFELLATVLFYAAVGFAVVILLAKSNASFAGTFQSALSQVTDGGVFACLQALFPVSAEYYWFMTCYLLLYILTPLMNAGARALTKKQYETMLILFLIWTSLIKSVIPVSFVTDDGGYGMKWFICLYLTGAYFRLRETGFATAQKDVAVTYKKNCSLCPFAMYAGSVVFIYATSLMLYKINLSSGRFAYFMTVPLHYNFILTFTGACGLFLCFKNMDMKNTKIMQVISKISSHTLGVYLLHAHPLLFYSWPVLTALLLGTPPRQNAGAFSLYVTATVLLLFICGFVVDLIRACLFRFILRRNI